MSSEIQVGHQNCAHCQGRGTCTSGVDRSSCRTCVGRLSYRQSKPKHGLPCSICKGFGHIEPMSQRFQQRTGPLIALYVMGTAVFLIFYGYKQHFSEVLAFLSTLTGSITAYYFSSRR